MEKCKQRVFMTGFGPRVNKLLMATMPAELLAVLSLANAQAPSKALLDKVTLLDRVKSS
jgi:hypothetical protein